MGPILTCPEEGELLAVATGEPTVVAIAQHLEGCPDCRERVEPPPGPRWRRAPGSPRQRDIAFHRARPGGGRRPRSRRGPARVAGCHRQIPGRRPARRRRPGAGLPGDPFPVLRRQRCRWQDGGDLDELVCDVQEPGIEPFAYLRDVLDRISMHANSRINELLPDRWQKLRMTPEGTEPGTRRACGPRKVGRGPSAVSIGGLAHARSKPRAFAGMYSAGRSRRSVLTNEGDPAT